MSKRPEPCPHCGGKARIRREKYWQPNVSFNAICESCFACSGWYKTEEEAIAAWNRRAASEANEALTLEELRGMDGEPVWLKIADGRWGLVDAVCDEVTLSSGASINLKKLIGQAYRRPPEGGNQPAPEEE